MPIEDYIPRPRPFQPAVANPDTLDAIERYADEYLGGATFVFHELASDLVHIDVHVCPTNPRFDCLTLITSGMSDRPMPAAKKFRVPPYAELMIRLPKSWPAIQTLKAVTDYHTEATWPIGVLKRAARMPHDCGSALGHGHTLTFTNPASPLHESVKFAGILLLPTVVGPKKSRTVKARDGRTIHVYVLHLLLPDELEYTYLHGVDALLDAFDAAKLSEVVDTSRASVLPG